MSPDIARLFFCVGIAGLFWLDRDPSRKTSPAIWIAIAWLVIGSSRNISEWLGAPPAVDGLEQYADGNPIDRMGLSLLQAAGLAVLVARRERTMDALKGNLALVLFLAYCLVSVLWSDFPLVTFKRWTKTMGNVTMLLVVLTEAHPRTSLKRLLAWTGFLLIPVSVLLIKYFPELGRAYSRWTWTPSFIGVATDKNGLGVICFVFGLAAFWRFMEALREGPAPGRYGRVVAHGTVVAMAVWLCLKADSSTSLGCLLLGSAVIFGLTLIGARRPTTVNRLMLAGLLSAVLAYTVFDAHTLAIQALGRETTLTGRTELWEELLHTPINPVIGTGFESFWLGDRASYFWEKYWWHPNQAHNGYLEMYLDLGYLGVALLVVLMAAGYRNIVASFAHDPAVAKLRLAFILVIPLYNITEAAFKLMNPVWIAFLLFTTSTPVPEVTAPVRLLLGPRLNPAYSRLPSSKVAAVAS